LARLRAEMPPTTNTAKTADQILRAFLKLPMRKPPPGVLGLRGLRGKSEGFRTIERLAG